MPVHRFQINVDALTAEGKKIRLDPRESLRLKGPILNVAVTLSASLHAPLQEMGIPLPPPVIGHALVDTGASGSCIDDEIARKLQAPAVDVVKMTTPSHDSVERNVYPIQVSLSDLNVTINLPRAIGATLRSQGLIALLGRDFLSHFLLIYDGTSGHVTLTY